MDSSFLYDVVLFKDDATWSILASSDDLDTLERWLKDNISDYRWRLKNQQLERWRSPRHYDLTFGIHIDRIGDEDAVLLRLRFDC